MGQPQTPMPRPKDHRPAWEWRRCSLFPFLLSALIDVQCYTSQTSKEECIEQQDLIPAFKGLIDAEVGSYLVRVTVQIGTPNGVHTTLNWMTPGTDATLTLGMPQRLPSHVIVLSGQVTVQGKGGTRRREGDWEVTTC